MKKIIGNIITILGSVSTALSLGTLTVFGYQYMWYSVQTIPAGRIMVALWILFVSILVTLVGQSISGRPAIKFEND